MRVLLSGFGTQAALDVFTRSVGPVSLLVAGPGRSGRTATLDALAESERRRDRPVVRLQGRPGERSIPAAALAPLVDPGLIDPDDPVTTGLAVMPAGAATVLVDDAQFLDPASAAVVSAIAERVVELGIRLVVAATMVPDRDLARIEDAVRRTGEVVELVPVGIDELERSGVEPAAELATRTGGWVGHLADVVAGESIDDDVARRLALASTDTRRLVEALAFGARPGSDALAELVGSHDPDPAWIEARRLGLLAHDRLTEVVAEATRGRTTPARRAFVARTVASTASDDHLDSLCDWLFGLGDLSDAAAELYEDRARREAHSRPRRALEWVDRARSAGRRGVVLDLLEAVTADRLGDHRQAVRLYERVPAAHVARAVAWWRLGRLDDAGRQAAAGPSADAAALATFFSLVGADCFDQDPPAASDAPHERPGEAAALVSAIRGWLGRGELAPLLRTADRHQLVGEPSTAPSPGTEAAVLASLMRHDVASASAIVVGAEVGATTDPLITVLSALVAVKANRVDEAEALMAELDGSGLQGREAMLAEAVAVSVAHRRGEAEPIDRRRDELSHRLRTLALDLLSVEVVGELAQAMVRHDPELAGRRLDELDRLIERSGRPPDPTAASAWMALLTAVAANDGDRVVAAAARVERDVVGDGGLDRVRRDAARSFAAAFSGRVDENDVRTVSSDLRQHGLLLEAARLTGVAALRTGDEAAARRLLKESRALRAARQAPGGGATVGVLSDREVDVARLVVDGRTHKEIGAELYISAKTVEHHVARIRRKLGAGSRADMIAAIRDELSARADA